MQQPTLVEVIQPKLAPEKLPLEEAVPDQPAAQPWNVSVAEEVGRSTLIGTITGGLYGQMVGGCLGYVNYLLQSMGSATPRGTLFTSSERIICGMLPGMVIGGAVGTVVVGILFGGFIGLCILVERLGQILLPASRQAPATRIASFTRRLTE